MRADQRTNRRKFSALSVVVALLALSAVGTTISRAVVVSSGVVGNFQDDGNFVHTGSELDWDNVSVTPVTDDSLDSGFQGSSKEEEPGNWICNTGGANPPKGNIERAYVSPRITSASNAFLDLAWVREDGNGDAHVNFEFNQSPSANPTINGSCPIVRAEGDFMLTYDFAGGDGAPDIRAWTWSGSAWGEIALQASDASAASNASAIADDPLVSGTQPVGVREFGELTLDLTADGLPENLIACPGYGYVNVRTRSSGESITSALQDRLPTTQVNLSSCASITVQKVDDLDQGLAGATFALHQDNGDGSFDADDDVQVDTCLTELGVQGTAAPATCTFGNLDPSPPAYFVRELLAPTGYQADPFVAKVSPDFREDAVVSHVFTNPLAVGSIEVIKTDARANLVSGVRFVALQGGVPATDRQGDPAECVTGSNGRCVIADLVPGSYTVHEDPATLPSTMLPAPDQAVVVVADVRVTVAFVNPLKPISIGLVKTVNGEEAVTAHEGDTLSYLLTVTNTGDLPLTVVAFGDVANGNAVNLPGGCDARVGSSVAAGASFTCAYSTAAGAIDVVNTATVAGEDSLGRRVNASDSATVDVVHPGIGLTKKVNGAKTYTGHAGDALTYTLDVTNDGDVPLVITGLADVANGGAVSLSTSCLNLLGSTLTTGATVSCSYPATAGTADVDNVATVTGIDAFAGVVTDTDTARVDVVHPAIALTKLVNGHPAVLAHEGDALLYTVLVENTGDIALTITSLADVANGSGVDLPDSCDNRVGSTLAAGASFLCTYAAAAGADDIDNTATVNGADGLPGGGVSASDRASVDVIHPAIDIVKRVNGGATATVHAGDPLTYDLTVTNTGDVALTVSNLVDIAGGQAVSLPGACLDHVGDSLAPGAHFSCSYGGPAPVDDIANTATVDGIDPLQLRVTDAATATVDVVHPAISISKLVNGVDAATVHAGDVLTYTLDITNVGDVALTLSALTDEANGGSVALPAGCTGLIGQRLAAGATRQCQYTATATVDVTNVATVTAGDGLPGGTVNDNDGAAADVVHPAIVLEKTVNGQAAVRVHAGDALAYSVKVTNTGDNQLTITALTDSAGGAPVDLPAGCDARVGATLAPGAFFVCEYGATAAGDIVNSASVAAVDGLPGGGVGSSDSASVDVIVPGVNIEKRVNGQPAVTVHAGDALTYSLAITNTGDVPLTLTALADSAGGTVVTLPATCTGLVGDGLAPAQSVNCSYPATASSDVTNTASVTGTDELGLAVNDASSAVVDVVHPAILIEKTVNGAAAVKVHAGEPTTYALKVTNTGDIALTVASLADVAAGAPVALPESCIDHVGDALAAGASFTCSYAAVAPATDVVNTATVVGHDGLPGGTVSSTDSALVDVINPNISLEKRVNGSTAVQVHVGDALTYTLRITNTGDGPVTLRTLNDVAGGSFVSLPSGCTELVGRTLAAGASVNCSYATVAEVDIVNTATVTGVDELDGPVRDDDSAAVDVVHPAITIVKTGATQAHEGDSVTYTFTVTNHGDIGLAGITVVDDKLGAVGEIAALAPGQTAVLTKAFTVPVGPANIVNVATACGTDPLEFEVCDTDDHELDPLHPAVTVVKAGPAQAHEGDAALYTFTVTNTGDVALTAVAVTDDKLGAIGTIPALAVGQSVQLSKTFTVPVGTANVVNVATACGVDPLDLEVCDTDDHELDPIHPAITIVKTADPTSFSGPSATVTYTYVITNTGDVRLTDIAVADDKLGVIGTLAALEPGESATMTKATVLTTSAATVNIGTAVGTDPLGLKVTDDDDAVVDVVLGQVFERELPRTGGDILGWVAAGLYLLAAGGLLLIARRRRQA